MKRLDFSIRLGYTNRIGNVSVCYPETGLLIYVYWLFYLRIFVVISIKQADFFTGIKKHRNHIFIFEFHILRFFKTDVHSKG